MNNEQFDKWQDGIAEQIFRVIARRFSVCWYDEEKEKAKKDITNIVLKEINCG